MDPVRETPLDRLVNAAASASAGMPRGSAAAPPHFQPKRRTPRRPRTTPIALMMAPMIDMSFTFLIFFVATTRFERPEGLLASAMPAVSGEPAPALPFSPIVIRVTRTGAGHDEYSLRIDGFEAAPSRLAGLAEFLRGVRELPGFDKRTPVVIAAENDIPWDHVVGCWNAVLKAGYEQIAFAEP